MIVVHYERNFAKAFFISHRLIRAQVKTDVLVRLLLVLIIIIFYSLVFIDKYITGSIVYFVLFNMSSLKVLLYAAMSLSIFNNWKLSSFLCECRMSFISTYSPTFFTNVEHCTHWFSKITSFISTVLHNAGEHKSRISVLSVLIYGSIPQISTISFRNYTI